MCYDFLCNTSINAKNDVFNSKLKESFVAL